MSLLTNGFVNNCGRLFGPSEQFEGDIVRVEVEKICVSRRERRALDLDSGRMTGNSEVISLPLD